MYVFCYTCESKEPNAKVTFLDDGAVFLFCKECLADCVYVIDAFAIDAIVEGVMTTVQTTLL
jgi:translation initiation factor 2 beta subunit (eIF-2beta)/eIF-5